jgi:hypothetical protein
VNLSKPHGLSGQTGALDQTPAILRYRVRIVPDMGTQIQ